jgi:uncharacterized protein YfaS (alpha-2-macroglobulin family)
MVMFLAVAFLLAPFRLWGGTPAESADKFVVSEFSPRGLVSGPTNISVTFSTPVISSDDVGRSVDSKAMPIVFTPSISGQGKWVSRSTFLYQLPSGHLQEATEFKAVVSEKLKDYRGVQLGGAKEFAFNTAPLELLDVRQTDADMEYETVKYQLQFNAPVNPAKLNSYMSITDEKGDKTEFYFENTGASNILYLRVPVLDATPIVFSIKPGLTSERGPLSMKNAFNAKVDRDVSLKIRNSWVGNDYSGSVIFIGTTAEVDVDKAKPFIEITPSGDFSIGNDGSGLRIYGDFPPRELITVKLRAGLTPYDKRGGSLAADWERSFVFPDYDPSLDFTSQGRFISPANEELLMPLSSVNIKKIDVTVDRVYDNNVVFITRDEWPYYISTLSKEIYRESFDISSEPNEKSEHSLDIGKILNGQHGLFQITAANSGSWPRTTRIINVTDIAGSVKMGDDTALVWANSLREGKPLEGVKVELYSSSNQIIASGLTDKHGVYLLKREEDWEPNLWPSLAILSNGDDVSVLRFNGNIWNTGNEAYTGAPYLNGKYQGICYAPRGVFRPGETVPIQMLIRTGDLSPEKPFPVQLKIYTSMGREWSSSSVMLSEMGMGSADISLSDAAPSGTWRASVHVPGETAPIAAGEFRVEDFAPPKINVTASSDVKELFRGDSPAINIYAEYLFGAAGEGLSYEVETSFIPREYSHPNWPDYYFTDYRLQFSPHSNIEATGELSSDGMASVTLPAIKENAGSILDASFRVGVREDGGRWVYKSVSVPYYPRKTLLGIKSPREGFVTNSPVPFAFAVIDTAGNPLDTDGVTLTVYKERSRRITTTVDGARRSELRTENMPLVSFDKALVKFEKGRAETSVTFPSGGSYSVVLDDAKGEASAALHFYVYDSRWAYGDEGDATLPETLTIKLDKDTYKTGERATATISGSFGGTALLSVETNSIIHYDTSAEGGKSVSFSFEVTSDMMPNAWVTAHMIRPVMPEDAWSAHRAFGAVPIVVDTSEKKLAIEIASPDRIEPARSNDFSLQIKDSAGRGVKGEAAVMLVDEGVLGLTRYKTPNFYEFYTKKRALTLSAYDIYTELMPLYLKAPSVLTPGGGYDDSMESMMKASMSPVKADRFKILSLVRRVSTDENGRADFTLDIPEFAGRGRLMVVAASAAAFGSAESTHTIARDVVTDITLPRVLSPRDVFESEIQLFNRTGRSLDMELELTLTGPLSLASVSGKPAAESKSYKQKIAIQAGEKPSAIPLVIKADDNSGVATVSLRALYGKNTQEQTIDIAVRPPYPRITKMGLFTLKPGESSVLDLPSDWFPGTRRAVVTVSGLPVVGITDMAKFLLEYPYGCLEQTVSSGWTLLTLPDLAAQIDPRLATREQMEYAISRVIMRIQSMQLYNGTFSSWPGGDALDWNTVYATHFLSEAEKRGWGVPVQTLRASLESLRYLISLPPQGEDKYVYGASLSVRAYAAYVMALRGEAPRAWMSYLKDNMSSMHQYGRILLAAAYAASGDKKTASSLLGDNVPPIVQGDGTEKLNYDSQLRTQALYLAAWNEIDPTSPNTLKAAAELLSMFHSAKWYTTQEAGWTMLSLANFYSFHKDEGTAFLTMSADGMDDLSTSGDVTMTSRISADTNKVTVKNSGNGTGYATWASDGVPNATPEAVDSGIKAIVTYYDSKGYPITQDSIIENGSRVRAQIILRPLAGEVKNIVVALPLPGGLEIENPRLTTPDDSSYEYSGYSYSARTEMRDDRLLLFVDYIYNKEFKWEFTMRAVTPGAFILPPIAAEGMYSPGTRSIGETSKITIK